MWGIIPLIIVIIGRIGIKESDRFLHLQEVKQAAASGDHQRTEELLETYQVDVEEALKVTVKQLFATPGYVRRQIGLLTMVWLFYSTSWVATNVYISYWLTSYAGWSAGQVANLLLVCGGIGFFFYILGGWLGEKFGRREVLIVTGILTGPLNLIFMFVHNTMWLAILYFLIYQATNGTWSGAGYAYWAESFPTRVRGAAVGWLGAMFTGGLILGTLLWTILISMATPAVTWFVIAVVLAFGECTTLLLPRIKPGQKLEAIAS